jgi:hypothetical protein
VVADGVSAVAVVVAEGASVDVCSAEDAFGFVLEVVGSGGWEVFEEFVYGVVVVGGLLAVAVRHRRRLWG